MKNFIVIILFSKDTAIEPTAIIKDEEIDECYSSFEFDTWKDAVHCINWINHHVENNDSPGFRSTCADDNPEVSRASKMRRISIGNYELLGDWADIFGYTQFGEFRGNHNEFKNSLQQWRVNVYGADFEYIDNNDDILNFSVWDNKLKSISIDEMN
jgi:hypothetical protein